LGGGKDRKIGVSKAFKFHAIDFGTEILLKAKQ
jgi:hypothetical protein